MKKKFIKSLLYLSIFVILTSCFSACNHQTQISSSETPSLITETTTSDTTSPLENTTSAQPTTTTTSTQPTTTTTTSTSNTSIPSYSSHPPHSYYTSTTTTSTPPPTTTSNTSIPSYSHPPHTPQTPPTDYDYANAPKESIHVLMWREYYESEQLLIDKYEKLTGVKVKTTVTTEAEYPTKLVSMVSGGNSPDIAMFQGESFPGIPLKSLQKINNIIKIDYNCWNKDYMNAYKVNGVYFGVAMPFSWLCESGNYITYYSPNILKECGITEDPYKLYKNGQWNWETQNQIIHKIQAGGYIPYSVQYYDTFMLSAGEDFIKYDGKQYITQLGTLTTNNLLTQTWMEVAKLQNDHCITALEQSNYSEQLEKTGIFTATSQIMNKESNLISSSIAKTLKAVPIAGPKGKIAYTPVRPVLCGIPKKAKNPEGAAYFLRYFLDVNNYNHSSTFHTKQFEDVFKIINNTNKTKKYIAYGSGLCEYIEKGTYNKICNRLATITTTDMARTLNSQKNLVEQPKIRANKDLARIKVN